MVTLRILIVVLPTLLLAGCLLLIGMQIGYSLGLYDYRVLVVGTVHEIGGDFSSVYGLYLYSYIAVGTLLSLLLLVMYQQLGSIWYRLIPVGLLFYPLLRLIYLKHETILLDAGDDSLTVPTLVADYAMAVMTLVLFILILINYFFRRKNSDL